MSKVFKGITSILEGGNDPVSRSKSQIDLKAMSPEEKAITEALAKAVAQQLGVIERQADLQRALFESVPGLFDETRAAADATGEELGSLPLSQSERFALDQAVENSLRLGEADIERFREQGIKNIRDVLAPSRGLLTTDSPVLNAAADVVRESQIQQGQLVRGLRAEAAGQEFDRLFERDKLRALLRQSAFENRLGLATGQSNIGLGLNPQVSIPQALSTVQQPRLAQPRGQNISSPVESFAKFAGGIGGLGTLTACHVAAEFYGWYTPQWFAARQWIAEGWRGQLADGFRRAYLRHGERVADWVRRSRTVRAMLRPLFEWAAARGLNG